MKKWTMVWGIVAAVTLVLGTALAVIGMSALNWDFRALDTLTYTEQAMSAEEAGIQDGDEIKSFMYNGNNWNVKIIKGDEFSIKYYTTERTKTADLTFNELSGELSFVYEEDWSWSIAGFKGIKMFGMSVEVVLPENIDITIRSTNVSVSVEGMDIGDVDIVGTNCDVELSNLTSGNIKIAGTNAEFEMKNCTAGDIEVNATNGNVDFKNVTCNDVKISGTNFDFDADKCTFKSITADGTNADISISESDVFQSLSFKGTNISVEYSATVSLEDFASITVSGTNSSCHINNSRRSEGYFSPTGSITFDLKGTNASARITTK